MAGHSELADLREARQRNGRLAVNARLGNWLCHVFRLGRRGPHSCCRIQLEIMNFAYVFAAQRHHVRAQHPIFGMGVLPRSVSAHAAAAFKVPAG